MEKNNRKIGYYTNSSEANELWLSILRNYCILKSFPFDYEILKPIRQENFSQVKNIHVCLFKLSIILKTRSSKLEEKITCRKNYLLKYTMRITT